MSSITPRSSGRPRGDRLPAWIRPVDKVLSFAVDRVHLISAVTPTNAVTELSRLEDGWRRGLEPSPAWRYEAPPVPIEVRRALDLVAQRLDDEPPLGPLYAARARELALEASMIEAVGTPKLRLLAHRRFVEAAGDAGAGDVGGVDVSGGGASQVAMPATTGGPMQVATGGPKRGATDELSFTAIDEDDPADAGWVVSDDPRDPRSLLCAMRAAIGTERLPWRVVVEPTLAALAATGDGVVFVAAGRRIRAVDVRRTVLHEIAGHVLPRHRAAAEPFGLFAIGTARGVDDQEGRALLIERAAGFCDRRRSEELGWRHAAADLALAGATFVDVVRALVDQGAPVDQAVRIACRVLRGGSRAGGGIAREALYLPAMSRVAAAMKQKGEVVGAMMRRGRIAASLASALAALVGESDEAAVALGSA